MQASTSTSRITLPWLLAAGLIAPVGLPCAQAADAKPADRTQQPEEDDFAQTPFTEYGEFNEDEEEASDTAFFQKGRFFGVSAGLGFQGIVGNRGLLWQGGFPTIDLRLHYWFDFNFALDLGGYFSNHFYDPSATDRVTVSWLSAQITLKYYFDTRNLSAPLSFASPYLLAGGGSYTKIEASSASSNTSNESTVGFNAGAGLEFVIKPKKLYFALENRWHFMGFSDTGSTTYQGSGIADLSGAFFTIVGNVLFTW